MRIALRAVWMGWLSLLLGACSKSPAPAAKPLPEVAAEAEGGYIDLGFAIRAREKLPDGSQALQVYGVHHGREVGLTVVLGPDWQAGSLGAGVPLVTYRDTVSYRSSGPPSDALLQVLDELYATKLQPSAMRPVTTFTAISLQGNPAELGKGPTKIKLFFDPGDENRYAELFTNIDLARGILQIHEKDQDYRPALIKALRAE